MSNFDRIIIPVFCISNMNSTKKVLTAFENRTEFILTYLDDNDVNESQLNSFSLKFLKQAVKCGLDEEDEFIIISNYKHFFTENYNKEYLLNQIISAYYFGCGILIGGISNFNRAVPLTKNLFWIDSFSSSNFIIIFKSLFLKIVHLDEQLDGTNFLSEITSNKMVMYPCISENRITENIKSHENDFLVANETLRMYQNVYCKFIEK